jgi:3-oxoacyl-[acyl-carrier protein] reductase
MRLEGKSAIITGAGRGLGKAIALAMSREGARVSIMSDHLTGHIGTLSEYMRLG